MGIFGGKKKDDHLKHEKLPSGEVHDPILTAVREQQPWEQAGNEHNLTVSPSAQRDVFGGAISNPDLSNPSRSREERPLDTIRSFEYQATGDERIKEQIETGRYGFRPRPDFVAMPSFSENPYGNQGSNVISLGDPNVQPEPPRQAYYPDAPTPVKNMNKKGLFGKKKKVVKD